MLFVISQGGNPTVPNREGYRVIQFLISSEPSELIAFSLKLFNISPGWPLAYSPSGEISFAQVLYQSGIRYISGRLLE